MEISQIVTNMQHKTNIFRCVFQINHIYYFFIALHKALSAFHTLCFLFKTFPSSFPSPSSRAEISARAEISPCIWPPISILCLSHDTPTFHCSNRSIKAFIQLISMQMNMHSRITSYPTRITSYPTVLTAYRIFSQ